MAASDERKPVTVLFADLAGSTELATRHDPEQLRALLAAFFDGRRLLERAYLKGAPVRMLNPKARGTAHGANRL